MWLANFDWPIFHDVRRKGPLMRTARIIHRTMVALTATLLLFILGCPGGPRRAAVSGEVLIDKEPLAEGTISFYPQDGIEGPEVGEAIKNGRYVIPVSRGVVIGKNKVVIRGFRKSGKQVPSLHEKGKMIDEMVRAVPAEFNDNSTLFREIRAGDNTENFDLPGVK
jgi:hypothetical protein